MGKTLHYPNGMSETAEMAALMGLPDLSENDLLLLRSGLAYVRTREALEGMTAAPGTLFEQLGGKPPK